MRAKDKGEQLLFLSDSRDPGLKPSERNPCTALPNVRAVHFVIGAHDGDSSQRDRSPPGSRKWGIPGLRQPEPRLGLTGIASDCSSSLRIPKRAVRPEGEPGDGN